MHPQYLHLQKARYMVIFPQRMNMNRHVAFPWKISNPFGQGTLQNTPPLPHIHVLTPSTSCRKHSTPKHSTPSPYPCIDSFDVMSSLEIKSWLHVWAATKVYAKHLTETVNVDHYRWWKLVCVQIWFDHLLPCIYYGNQLTTVVQNTPDRKTTPELSPTRQR